MSIAHFYTTAREPTVYNTCAYTQPTELSVIYTHVHFPMPPPRMLSDRIYRLRDFSGTTCALRMGRAFAIGRGPCASSRPLASCKFSRLNAVVFWQKAAHTVRKRIFVISGRRAGLEICVSPSLLCCTTIDSTRFATTWVRLAPSPKPSPKSVKVVDATVAYCRPCEETPWGESWGGGRMVCSGERYTRGRRPTPRSQNTCAI